MLLVNTKRGITCEILAALVNGRDDDSLRTLSLKFRRWQHQLRIFEECQAAGSAAIIQFEPLLQEWFDQTGETGVAQMRAVLRNWDKQLREQFNITIGPRYLLFVHDSAPCQPHLRRN